MVKVSALNACSVVISYCIFQVRQWIDHILIDQINPTQPKASVLSDNIKDGTADATSERAAQKQPSRYKSMDFRESLFIQSYGNFLITLNNMQRVEENSCMRRNIPALVRNEFWQHLVAVCSKLHRLSVSSPPALKYLQALLSALYNIQMESIVGRDKGKKYAGASSNSQKKLKFKSDRNSYKTMDNLTHENNTDNLGQMTIHVEGTSKKNNELDEVVNDLVAESMAALLSNDSSKVRQENFGDSGGEILAYNLDQIRFLVGLLGMRSRKLSGGNGNNEVNNFYADLWSRLEKEAIEGSLHPVTRKIIHHDNATYSAALPVFNILNVIFESKMLKANDGAEPEEIAAEIANLFFVIMESLPVPLRCRYLTEKLSELYDAGISTMKKLESETPVCTSYFRFMAIIVERMLHCDATNDDCCTEMLASHLTMLPEDKFRTFPQLLVDITSTLFLKNSQSFAETGMECNRILQIIFRTCSKHIPDKDLEQILKILHKGCENNLTFLHINNDPEETGGDCSHMKMIFGRIVRLLGDLINQNPCLWLCYTPEGRSHFLAILFKCSVVLPNYDGGDENLTGLQKITTNLWVKGLCELPNNVDADPEMQEICMVTGPVVEFVNEQLLLLVEEANLGGGDRPFMDGAIEVLARQAWRFLECMHDRYLKGIRFSRTNECWKTVLSFMMVDPSQNQKKGLDVRLLAERICITNFPEIDLKKYKENAPQINVTSIGTVHCAFFMKVCSFILFGDKSDPKKCVDGELEKHVNNILSDDLVSAVTNPRSKCSISECNDKCMDTLSEKLLQVLASIALKNHLTNGSKKSFRSIGGLAQDVVVHGGLLSTKLLNMALERSIMYGWENSLCLERLLWCIKSTKGDAMLSINIEEMMNKTVNRRNEGGETDQMEYVAMDNSVDISDGIWSEGQIHTMIILMTFARRPKVSSILMTEIGRVLSLDPVGEVEASEQLEETRNHEEAKNRITPCLFLVAACLRCLMDPRHTKEGADSEIEAGVILMADERNGLKALLQMVLNWRQHFEDDFLFSTDILPEENTLSTREEKIDKVTFVIAVSGILDVAVKNLTTNRLNRVECGCTEAEAEESPITLEAAHWDLILCALSSWVQSIEETNLLSVFCIEGCQEISVQSLSHEISIRNFCSAIALLADTVSSYVNTIKNRAKHDFRQSTASKQNEHDLVVLEEWGDFFAAGIYATVLNAFVSVATHFQLEYDNAGEENQNATDLATHFKQLLKVQLLRGLGSVLRNIPDNQLFETHQLPAKYNTDDICTCSADELAMPDKIVFLLNHLSPLLISPERAIKFTALHLLQRTMEKVAEHEEKRNSAKITVDAHLEANNGESEDYRELPKRLVEILDKYEPMLVTLFAEFEFAFGEPLPTPLPAGSAAYNTTLCYLMAWQVAISLVEKVSGDDLRPKYSEFLRKGTHLDTLMMALFHLMATPPVESSMETSFDFAGNLEVSFNYEDSWNKGEERSFLDMLTPTKTHHPEANIVTTGYKIEIPALDCGVEKSCEQPQVEMHQLAHSIYYQMLNYLPALIRSWWTLADKRTASVVERFTVSRITPLLWAEEVDRINGSSAKVHNNMTIKVRSSVREVVATYILGDDGSEGSMELVVQLPANFPLGAVQVESGKRVGVTIAQWRTWMLQLTTFLQHQNGSIVDGLSIWKRNVDKRFEGVEECYICFYVIHGSNHQLPRLACRTCKKKFHAACLYKWFKTSNNSTCPLCRNLF